MMSFNKVLLLLPGLQFMLYPMAVQAQSADIDHAFAQTGAEARTSLTIPLGHSPNNTKTAPRLNLGVRNYQQPSNSTTNWMRADRQDYRDVSLCFTLEETPKLMMNEQNLWRPADEQANIGTAGKIGLGVGAVVLAGVAVLAVIYSTTDFAEDA